MKYTGCPAVFSTLRLTQQSLQKTEKQTNQKKKTHTAMSNMCCNHNAGFQGIGRRPSQVPECQNVMFSIPELHPHPQAAEASRSQTGSWN